jgi:hypothetical protein
MPVMPPGVPVVHSTRVSALIWSRERGSPAARVESALPGQRRVHGDALLDGQQRRQVGHAVRCRAQAHGPLRCGMAGALGDGAGVPADGGGPDGGDDGPGPGTNERAGVGGELLINGSPVFDTQTCGLFRDVHGALFVQLSGVQGGEGVWHLCQGLGCAEQPPAAVRGLAPGQRDLFGRAQAVFLGAVFAQVLGGQCRPVGGFLAEPRLEGHSKPRLLPGQHALHVLRGAELVDQPGIVSGKVSTQQETCRRDPVLQAKPRRTRAGGSGVGEQYVGKQGLGKRVLPEGAVGAKVLGERVLRKDIVGVYEVPVIVIR